MSSRPQVAVPYRLEAAPGEAWPFYAQDEIDAVGEVLRSGKVNQWTGTKVVEFQSAYERHVGTGRAIALANGSLALELALRAFGIGPGDEVVVSPRSFVASASRVRLVGATPVFADVDRDNGAISGETISRVITSRTRAIIPVHLGGWPADMPGIMKLAKERDLRVIEDCAQAHGAEIGGRPVGSFGDAAAFSFCQDKIITTGGEGGMLIIGDSDAFEWAWSFKDHGKSLEKVRSPAREPGFRWLHDIVGTNWRMLEMSAAIGLIQLEKLNQWRALRTRNALIWAQALRGIAGLRMPLPDAADTGAYYKLYAYLSPETPNLEGTRQRILSEAGELGIRLFSGSCSEIYLERAFSDLKVDRLPVARELGETSLMFEVHPTLDPDLLEHRARAVASIIAEAIC